VADVREPESLPGLAVRRAAAVRERFGARAIIAMSGRAVAPEAGAGSTSCTKSARLAPVAWRTFEIDSVDGQRSRPSGLVRFDLLKLVASRPALRARPDAVMP